MNEIIEKENIIIEDIIYKISRYGVDLKSFEDICLSELEVAIKDSTIKYIIIDEIGSMQLFSDKYKKMLIRLLNCNKPVIGTIFECLDDFKKNNNVKLVEITFDNRDELPIKIVEMISKSDVYL